MATTGSTTARDAIAALSARPSLPPELAAAIRNAADAATALHRERLVEKAESAFGAYERGRYQDALRAIKPVADEAPGVAGVRELAGLAAYRSGRWREAVRHLQAAGELSDATEHMPVLMDCQRALHKPKKVADLWAELRHSSPEPDVLAEGRIVAAASLADDRGPQRCHRHAGHGGRAKALRNPSDRHVRQWYLLADLYERAGDVPTGARVLRAGAAGGPRGLRRDRPAARLSVRTDPRERAGTTEGQATAAGRTREPLGRRHRRRRPAAGGAGRRRWSASSWARRAVAVVVVRRVVVVGGARAVVGSLDRDQGPDGGQRPDQRGVGVAHLDAAVALRASRRWRGRSRAARRRR